MYIIARRGLHSGRDRREDGIQRTIMPRVQAGRDEPGLAYREPLA